MAVRSREAGGSTVLIRLATLVGLTFWFIPLLAAVAQAQSPSNLPAGVISVEIDNQAIDAVTSPVTSNPTPEISGRVDVGVSTVDIVVSGSSDASVSADLDDRGRFRVSLPQSLPDGQYSLALSGLPIGSFTVQVQGQAAAARDPGPPLDIARVVPYPVDFGNAVPGIGFLDGRFFTLHEEAMRTAAADGDPTAAQVRDVERRLAESGWLQRYESRLAVPTTDDNTTFSVQFSSFVVEYASGDAAQAAFQSLTEGGSNVQAPQVGDASAVSLFNGVTPDTGVNYQAARMVFRLGPMLVVIAYADLLNRPPDLDLLNAVAQSVAARGVIVAERGSVPLGSMVLRLDPSSATGRLIRRDLYDVRAGMLTALYAEDDATRGSRVALYTGTTDVFSATTSGTFTHDAAARRADQPNRVNAVQPAPTSVIGVEGESPSPEAATPAPRAQSQSESESETAPASAQVYFLSSLFAFPAPADASSWLESQRQAILATGDNAQTKLTPVEEGPKFGDETYTFATKRGSGEGEQAATGFRMYTRVGQLVAALDVESVPGVQLNGVAQLMNLQLSCIDDGGCSTYAPLPASVFGGQDPPVSPRTRRVQTETPTPAAILAPTPVPTAAPPPPTEPPPPPVEEVPVEEPTAPVEEPTVPVEEPTPEEAPTEAPPAEEATPPPAEEPTAVPSEEPAPPTEEGTPPVSEEPAPPAEEPSPSPSPEVPPPAEEPTAETALPPAEEPTAIPTPAPVIEPTAIPTPAPAEEPTKEPRNNDDNNRRGNNKKKNKD